MKISQLIISFSLIINQALNAYDSIYEKTGVGEIEVKSIPDRIALEASSEGNYFRANNGLFRSLFRFISDNEVEMTVPVEAEVSPGRMRFFVGEGDKGKLLDSRDEIEVRRMPRLRVVAIGIRGSYTEGRFRKHENELLKWLKRNKKYEQVAPAYAVYWHGPFVPGFFKRSEVHLPITKKKKSPKKNNPQEPKSK